MTTTARDRAPGTSPEGRRALLVAGIPENARMLQKWSGLTREQARALAAFTAGTLRRPTEAVRAGYAEMFGGRVQPTDAGHVFHRRPVRVESYGSAGEWLPTFADPRAGTVPAESRCTPAHWDAMTRTRAERGTWAARWAGGIAGAPAIPATVRQDDPRTGPAELAELPAAELANDQHQDRTTTAPARGPDEGTRSERSYRAPP